MNHHKISVGYDVSRFVLQRWRHALDKVEQTFTPRLDVRAVLDIIRRPETLSSSIVALVEQRVESLQNKSLIRFRCFTHLPLPFVSRHFRPRKPAKRFSTNLGAGPQDPKALIHRPQGYWRR